MAPVVPERYSQADLKLLTIYFVVPMVVVGSPMKQTKMIYIMRQNEIQHNMLSIAGINYIFKKDTTSPKAYMIVYLLFCDYSHHLFFFFPIVCLMFYILVDVV